MLPVTENKFGHTVLVAFILVPFACYLCCNIEVAFCVFFDECHVAASAIVEQMLCMKSKQHFKKHSLCVISPL